MGLARAHREGTVLGGWAPGERLPPPPPALPGAVGHSAVGFGEKLGHSQVTTRRLASVTSSSE